jgi:hypothetical protein
VQVNLALSPLQPVRTITRRAAPASKTALLFSGATDLMDATSNAAGGL